MAEIHDEEVLGKAYDSRLMKRLLVYLRPHWTKVIFSIVLLIIVGTLELAGPTLTQFTFDYIIRPAANQGHSGTSWTTNLILKIGSALNLRFDGMHGINVIGAAYLILLILGFLFNYFETVVMQQVGQYIMYDLRAQLFSHLQRADIRYYDKNPVGRIMTRLTTDVDALNELFSSGVVSLCGDLFTIIAITIWMLSENWRLALVTFTIVPAFISITVWFRKGARDTYRQVRVKIARINAFMQEHVTGMSVVQLFNREKKEMAQFDKINEDHRDANIRSIFYYAIFFPAIDIVSSVGVALLVWYGGGQVVRNSLSLGALVAFIQLAQRFYNPIRDISEKYNILQAAMASSERIFKLLDTPLGIVTPEHPKRPVNWRGEIEFRNIWFAYNADGKTIKPETESASTNGLEHIGDKKSEEIEWVLRDVSFKVNPGESVAIVGHTGAGKTTITNLLLRFYDIQQGIILIDGVDIRELDLHELRENFSIVLQDVFLYTGDVSGNIRLGNKSISDERVQFAAREVHADEFIQRLPKGYATPVRERGAGLSVGQKQLLAFARALAFDPRVLILDEATSSIDTETELLIRDALTRLMKGRTSIIIAHRLSTIQSCDKIIVMHKGQIREMGAHQELLALKGIYYKLYELQYKEQSVGAEPQLASGD